MLYSLIKSGFKTEYLILALLSVPVILFSLSFHELSHGYIAYKLGDDTAKRMGRLTLNPAKHLDPIGTLMMLFVGFGYAKPVPVNPYAFKNPKKGMALTALAGPVSNLILSFISILILMILNASSDIPLLYPETEYQLSWLVVLMTREKSFTIAQMLLVTLSTLLLLFHTLNLSLAVFNLIPIPPLDGSRLLNIFLPEDVYFGIMKYERFILIGLFLAISFLPFSPVSWVTDRISEGLQSLLGLIPGL